MIIKTNIDKQQFERIKFILSQFDLKSTHGDIDKIINEAILFYYKEILNNVNHGNEHDDKPLIETI